ncbi:MAG: Na+/H+ antiporter subunit D [Pseudomonadota bacterium]
MAAADKPLVDKTEALVQVAPVLADWLLIAPLVTGFIFGSLCLMTRKDAKNQSAIAIAGLTLNALFVILLFSQVQSRGMVVMTMGSWLPPFGITFAADFLGATFALITGIVALAVGIYAQNDINRTKKRYGFYPFLLLMTAGVSSAFLTGDIFNLYVWFEVLLIGSFGLLILGSERAQLDGATKYAFLNLIATTLFLIAVAYLYGIFGTLNMADISRVAASGADEGPRFTLAVLFLFAFAMKAAAVPLNFWLPASYHTPRISVSAVFAGLLTKVGVYALFRIFMTLFPSEGAELGLVIAIIAAATMVIGAIGALAQSDVRRLLGFVVISGIGYMLAGLALGSAMGISGAVFYAAHSMVLMTALYLLIGIMGRKMNTFDLHRAGGLYTSDVGLAAVAFVLVFAASGLPPFSGLWPKVMLIKASLDVGVWWLAASIIISGILTTIALVRVFAFSFWRNAPTDERDAGTLNAPSAGQPVYIATIGLTILTVIAGIFPEPFIAASDQAAAQLLRPQVYVEAVLGQTAVAEMVGSAR